ncbi:hypothetical protein [Pseudoflavonifractor sp. An85]|uniref:hypothetical protein n=1 Tax=Pseudoflavonifractor sp. An85 TaxID=1965661 RepID=UPI000B36F6F1|nr:hypothetical protein [Pseudoflavonifractor sp. An85]OUN19413.1 hypothetical protein B5G37_13600 [Pseudoflavonifractor sp. An85]
MDRYHESATVVSEDAAQRLVDEHKARVWRNPRSGITRFYLSVDALEDLIGLDVEFYKSGNVRRCSYIDADGEVVRVANSRAYTRWTKTFIENGSIYTEWALYGEDIAELIALNIAKAAEPEAETEECDEEIDNASKLNIGDIVIRSGDTVVVTEVVNSEIFRYRVIEARDPRTIGAKGGRNVKLGPVRRIRKGGKNEQSEENE